MAQPTNLKLSRFEKEAVDNQASLSSPIVPFSFAVSCLANDEITMKEFLLLEQLQP